MPPPAGVSDFIIRTVSSDLIGGAMVCEHNRWNPEAAAFWATKPRFWKSTFIMVPISLSSAARQMFCRSIRV